MVSITGHRFNPEKANKLLDPKRRELLNLDKILPLVAIQSNDVVADLGAGNGFFTLPFAQATSKTVYAVDIEPKMLELLKERADQEGLENIQYIESNLEEIKLEDNTIDIAFTAFVTHEIPNLEKALEEMRRILKQGGKLVILDWEAVESEVGPPLHHRISSQTMLELLQKNNFNANLVLVNPSVYAITVQL